jgi:hypothetical protein
LELNELERACKELGHNPTNSELKNALKVMDTDHSGSVSFEEFAAWWRSGRRGLSPNIGKAIQKKSKRAARGLERILGVAKPPDVKETVSHIINFSSGPKFEEGRASINFTLYAGNLENFA